MCFLIPQLLATVRNSQNSPFSRIRNLSETIFKRTLKHEEQFGIFTRIPMGKLSLTFDPAMVEIRQIQIFTEGTTGVFSFQSLSLIFFFSTQCEQISSSYQQSLNSSQSASIAVPLQCGLSLSFLC